jgi:hypothetical protein
VETGLHGVQKIELHSGHCRYVVRAKAGGRQTTHDATGRAPKSAGASLRRYNEQALQEVCSHQVQQMLAVDIRSLSPLGGLAHIMLVRGFVCSIGQDHR